LLDSFTNTPVGMSMGLSMGYDSTASNFAYRAISVDSAGKIKIGTQYIDDSTDFTLTTSPVTALGAIVDDVSPASVSNDGDIGILRMTANRKLLAHVDGFYNATTNINLNPESVGLIAHTNAASPAITDQIIRVTGGASAGTITSANFHGIDVRAKLYVTDAATEIAVPGIDIGSANTGLAVGLFDASGNRMPTMDAVGRQGLVQIADGTNVVPVLTGTVKTLPLSLHDGTTLITFGTGTTKTVPTELNDGTTKIVFGTGTIKNVPCGLNDGTTQVKYPTASQEAYGASIGGLTIRTATSGTKKSRVFSITLVSDADAVIALSDGFGTYPCKSGIPIVLNYGVVGKLQNNADTAITAATTSITANIGALVTYLEE
jgi:hypothetical protein